MDLALPGSPKGPSLGGSGSPWEPPWPLWKPPVLGNKQESALCSVNSQPILHRPASCTCEEDALPIRRLANFFMPCSVAS